MNSTYYKNTPSFWHLFIKICAFFFIIICLLLAVFIVFFNGNNIKSPLLKLLNEHSSLNIDFNEVEFSALYPNILKIKGLKLDNSSIDEVYCEYDLKDAIYNQDFIVNDLYVRDVQLDEQTYQKLLKEKLGFKTIKIKNLSLVSSALKSAEIFLPKADANFKDITISDQKINLKQAQIEANEGEFLGIKIKNLQFNGNLDSNTFSFNKLSLNTLGGFLEASGEFDRLSKTLKFKDLSLKRIIIKDPLPFLEITADNVALDNLSIAKDNLYLGELSGVFNDLHFKQNKLKGSFTGNIGEITLSDLNLTFENNQLQATFDDTSSFKAQGDYLNGSYSILANLTSQLLEIDKLSFNHVKFEPTDKFVENLKNKLICPVTINKLDLKNIEFISHMEDLPLSIKTIDGTLDNFSFDKQSKLCNKAAAAKLKIKNTFYSDLYIYNLDLLANLTDDLINLTVSDLTLRESSINGALSYNRQSHHFFVIASAHNFELSSLNSSLIPHTLSGALDFELTLKGIYEKENFWQGLQGEIKASGEKILISAFGLDLLNGGDKKSYTLDLTQMLHALSDADCGLIKPAFNCEFNGQLGKMQFSSETISSKIHAFAQLDLNTLKLNGQMHLVSLPLDSSSTLELKGTIDSPLFKLDAIERGERRPGIMPKINGVQKP